ncbi:MAG TPA: hypothetical protein VNC60_05605 [Actinomycetota bacterium]|nr:hypothetical protein [Actinomycetota bacterium]
MHRTIARGATIVCGFLFVAAVFALPAAAQTTGSVSDDDDQIVLHGSLQVADGETVGAAVIFDGPAIVDGTVRESLVVFNGSVEISGAVRKDVVVFNGDVIVRSGATIGGNLVTQSAPTVEPGARVTGEQRSVGAEVDLTDVGLASRFAWWVAYSLSALALGLILLALAPRLDEAIVRATRDRRGPSIVAGVAVFFLLPIVAVVLLATVVGIPLGLFLLLALALLYTVGYVAGAHAIGRMVVKPPASRYVGFLAGLGIVRLLALVPVVGGIVWAITAIVGLGVLVVAARRVPHEPAPVISPTPPPMPTMTT